MSSQRKLFPYLSMLIENLSVRRNFKRISNILGHFCDFTSIGGFRYFTHRTPFHIRLPAIIVFNISLGLLIYQVSYIVNQYSLNSQSITTSIIKSSDSPLPHIFLCPSLKNQTKFPLFKEYQNSLGDLIPNLVKPCIAKIDEKTINCVTFIQKTLIGFCIHVSYNYSELGQKNINHLAVKNFYLRFHYEVNLTSNVQIFLAPFNETELFQENYVIPSGLKPPLTIIRPNVLTMIRINELFRVSITFTTEFKKSKVFKTNSLEPLKIETLSNENSFETQNFLSCIDFIYENEIIKSKCPERIFVSFRLRYISDETNMTFASTPCSHRAAKKAQKYCESLEPDASFYLADVSALSNYKLPKFLSPKMAAGNVIITFRGMQKRITLYTRKTEIWKLISDIGGTFALYTGFTFLSILETIAFFSSSRLRKSAAQDDQTLMERKNPPIRFPIQSKRFNKSVEMTKEKVTKVCKRFRKIQPINEPT